LLVYSLITNRCLQERYCEQRFGDVYSRYRAAVPMLLVRPSGVKRLIQGLPALGAQAPVPGPSNPDEIVPELRWYLVGLVALLVCSGLAWILAS